MCFRNYLTHDSDPWRSSTHDAAYTIFDIPNITVVDVLHLFITF